MTHRTRAPAIVLLVALAFFVGVPPSLFALDRPPDSYGGLGNDPGQTSSDVVLVTDDGDPDDWANSDEGEENEGVEQGKTGGDDGKLQDYLDSIRGLILRIKLSLDGIL